MGILLLGLWILAHTVWRTRRDPSYRPAFLSYLQEQFRLSIPTGAFLVFLLLAIAMWTVFTVFFRPQ